MFLLVLFIGGFPFARRWVTVMLLAPSQLTGPIIVRMEGSVVAAAWRLSTRRNEQEACTCLFLQTVQTMEFQ